MSQLVEYQLQHQIATLTLNNGKANAISHALIADFNQALDKAEEARAVVVVRGRAGMFCGGYDLTVMQESMAAAMKLVEKGSRLARRLLAFPTPVIMACGGHAVAKGAFLLLSSDYRIGTQGDFKIGLNEVAIGMTMHHAGIELARGRLSPVYFNRAVNNAEIFNPDDALTAGFLDKVVDEADFDDMVLTVAQATSKLDMRAHRQTKLKARMNLLTTLDAAIDADLSGSL